MDVLSQLLRQVPENSARPTPAGVLPAVVTRSDAGGVFVTVLNAATAHPLGPCRAATYLAEVVSTTTAGTSYRYTPRPLPEGTRVIVTNTAAGVWVLAHELP